MSAVMVCVNESVPDPVQRDAVPIPAARTGRTFRCTGCGERWRVRSEGMLPAGTFRTWPPRSFCFREWAYETTGNDVGLPIVLR
jgi:hypothetical protein